MGETYMSAKEIMQEIADLKIRLAFQQEFEEEVDELAARARLTDAEQDQQMRDLEAKARKAIAANMGRRRPPHEGTRRFPLGLRLIALVALMGMVGLGSAMATVHMVQVGLLRLDVHSYPERTSYGLVPAGSTMTVPQEWAGDFYPAYMPDGFELAYCHPPVASYLGPNGETLTFSEETLGSRTSLDTENAHLSSLLINGAEATLIEKEGWTAVVWSANNRLFIADMDGGKEELLRVAASVILIR